MASAERPSAEWSVPSAIGFHHTAEAKNENGTARYTHTFFNLIRDFLHGTLLEGNTPAEKKEKNKNILSSRGVRTSDFIVTSYQVYRHTEIVFVC